MLVCKNISHKPNDELCMVHLLLEKMSVLDLDVLSYENVLICFSWMLFHERAKGE